MFQECEDDEDELYQDEADSSLSDADSELQFRLYSQLHYGAENQDAHEDVREEESSVPQAPPQQKSSPPPAAPVDVIVIDSGPDAITLSDSTEEDDSVCTKKGLTSIAHRSGTRQTSIAHRSGTRQTSIAHRRGTPLNTHAHVPSRSQTRSIYLGDIVVLESESEENSDSDSVPPYVEDLGSDSDSDGLENWMLLGPEKHDGDQNIQLNCSLPDNCEKREHVNDGAKKTSWVVSERDKEAQIYNKGVGPTPRRLSNRYYTNKSVTCHNCSRIGHLSKNCPTPKKVPCCSLCGHRGHLARTCPERHCSNCRLPGHTNNNCLEKAYWHKRCHRCGMSGHFIDACPEVWRQYHQTITPGPICESQNLDACKSPAYCYNCSKKGHFGFECPERRMYNGTYPTLPFVSYYDQTRDIKCREHRLKKKAKELKDAGLIDLPDEGAGSSTPQPPTKKQKTNYHQSLFHTPSQTNNPNSQKRRIAHTPKHHPQLQSTPSNMKQAPQTPWTWGKNPPHSAFTPQEHSQKKAKKKKKKKKSAVIEEDAAFPRGCAHANMNVISPWTANKPGMLFGKKNNKKTESQTKKKERIWRKRQKNAARDDATYAPDNLFTIKQRRSR